MTLKLTPTEKKILHHRLEVPDAIADVIDHFPLFEIEEVCKLLIAEQYDTARREYPILTDLVLEDAVEGSTYLAGCRADCLHPLQLANLERSAESLARKVGLYTDSPSLSIPLS
jgi:hypothetical protein